MHLIVTVEGTTFPTEVRVKPAESTGLREVLCFEFRGPTRSIDVPDHWLGTEDDGRSLCIGLGDGPVQDVNISSTDSWTALEIRGEPEGNEGQFGVRTLSESIPQQVSTPPSPTPIVIGPRTQDVVDAPSAFASRPPYAPVMNQFAISQEYVFFDTDDRNALASDSPVRGTMHQYTVGRHPLGFALGDWLNTATTDPGETVASATTTIVDDSGISQRQRRDSDETLDSSSRQFDSVQRTDTASVTSRATETAFSLGTDPTYLQPFGPLAQIFKQLSPAITLGFSAGRSNAWGRTASGVSQVLTQEFERSARNTLASQATSDTRVTQATTQKHRIGAYRNDDISQVRNIAVFRVNQQLMTRTTKTGERAVVLVKAPHIDTPFSTRDDVVTNAAVLNAVLIDPQHRPTLDMLASLDPSVNDISEEYFATEPVEVTFEIVNAGDELHLTLHGGDAGTGPDFWEARTSATEKEKKTVTIPTGARFVPLCLDVRASGQHYLARWRNQVEIENLKIDKLLKSQPRFALRSGQTKSFRINDGLPEDYTQRVARHTESVRRLHTHLNDHLAYYRLAIELLDDPQTRWSRLQKIDDEALRPVDMNPLGIVGNRIAYALNEPSADRENRGEERVDGLVSIPTAATYSIAMPEGLPTKTYPNGGGEDDNTYVDLPKTTNGDSAWPKLQYRSVPTQLTDLLKDIAARLDDTDPNELKGTGEPEVPKVQTPDVPDSSGGEESGGQGEAEEAEGK